MLLTSCRMFYWIYHKSGGLHPLVDRKLIVFPRCLTSRRFSCLASTRRLRWLHLLQTWTQNTNRSDRPWNKRTCEKTSCGFRCRFDTCKNTRHLAQPEVSTISATRSELGVQTPLSLWTVMSVLSFLFRRCWNSMRRRTLRWWFSTLWWLEPQCSGGHHSWHWSN